jgi:hypothetical protein
MTGLSPDNQNQTELQTMESDVIDRAARGSKPKAYFWPGPAFVGLVGVSHVGRAVVCLLPSAMQPAPPCWLVLQME